MGCDNNDMDMYWRKPQREHERIFDRFGITGCSCGQWECTLSRNNVINERAWQAHVAAQREAHDRKRERELREKLEGLAVRWYELGENDVFVEELRALLAQQREGK